MQVGAPEQVNQAPVIDSVYQSSDSANSGESLTFALQARDPEGQALTFAWTADAGTLGAAVTNGGTSEVQWTAPAAAGPVVVQVVVTDALGASTTQIFGVDVAVPPVVYGPSCNGMTGTECQGESCCSSILVPGGAFPMGRSVSGTDAFASGNSNEQPEHAVTVSAFYLDTYEVTVGRFRKFVEQYNGTPPVAGAGEHPRIAGSGWQAAWNSSLPGTQAGLISALKCYVPSNTWTDTAGANETQAISCVNWYESFAFCAWDGGRLPTEAEWEYAAAGGAENRLYPWGQAAPSASYLNYAGSDYSSHIEVGSHAAGAGRWGQQDLAGGMFEWLVDGYDSGWYAGGGLSCSDCANLSSAMGRVLRGGGWNNPASSYLTAAGRHWSAPVNRGSDAGFRCARNP